MSSLPKSAGLIHLPLPWASLLFQLPFVGRGKGGWTDLVSYLLVMCYVSVVWLWDGSVGMKWVGRYVGGWGRRWGYEYINFLSP